jgi:hypothetical protein
MCADSSGKELDVVFIDDDALIRMAWEMKARKSKIRLGTFSTIEEFYRVADLLDRNLPIYIDGDLGNGVRGDREAKKMYYDLGFRRIILATGSEPDTFGKMEWILAIIPKEPPESWDAY